ncbi:ribonuclease P protein component [Marinactinospora thermotolerans]|uniref:Ribonuclease P protein component n=1 Tax=Marinactinospora thermotolerans DSM 45154 TaxID=1122192 RepID=A0A1T4REL5_9ACTN|nr:ribonuclease P protein component [Marinactinospora thermotolerans]SKA14071.1 ribonuclease P protein component [Marinactinospora thermotolerans DSM 45154]
MLSPRNRMRRSAEFGLVMRRGRRTGRDSLIVAYLPPRPAEEGTPAPAEEPRVGFVVSKAVGGAVVRKQVQRRLRHLVRERLSLLPPGSLMVIRAKPTAADQTYHTLGEQLDDALRSVTRPRGPAKRRRGRAAGTPEDTPVGGSPQSGGEDTVRETAQRPSGERATS